MATRTIPTPPSALPVPLLTVMPPLFAMLLEHAKTCKPCGNYLHRNPFEMDARPCDNGKRALIALSLNPSPMTLDAVLVSIERLAASRFPLCRKCERIIRTGELTIGALGHEHLDCDLPVIEPFDQILRRIR